MSESNPTAAACADGSSCDCPPPAARPAEAVHDPRADLLRLAQALTHTRSQALLIEYLRLRRAVR